MKYTRSALGLLNSQYRSVLKKCLLINLGLFTLAMPAKAEFSLTPEDLSSNSNITWKVWEEGETKSMTVNLPGGVRQIFNYSHTPATGRTVRDTRLSVDAASAAPVDADFKSIEPGGSNGGGLYIGSGAIVSSVNANFIKNKTNNGGGMYNYGKISAVTGDYYDNSAASGNGGALTNTSVASISVMRSNFIKNKATGAGGAWYQVGNIDYAISNFIKNSAGSQGGAIFNYNTATIGYLKGLFVDNTSTGVGGAIYNNGQIGTLDAQFYTNKSTENNGGAIHNTAGAIISKISNGVFDSNSAAQGGAINNLGTITELTADFLNNTATGNGGGLYNTGVIGTLTGDFNANSAASGGGLRNNSGAIITTIDGDFTSNTATGNGGGLYNAGVISNLLSNFATNSAANGGGLYLGDDSASINEITGNFTGNTATGKGGGIYAENSNILSIVGNFENNSAGSQGGAIYASSSDDRILDSIKGNFTGNTVSGEGDVSGGAIAIDGPIAVSLLTGNFTNNAATSSDGEAKGGAIFLSGGVGVSFVADNQNILFSNNTANGAYNDMYFAGSDAIINLVAKATRNITFNGTIESDATADDGSTVSYININNVSKGGNYIFNNTVSGVGIKLYNDAQVILGSYEQADETTSYGLLNLNSLTNDANGGLINAQNDQYQDLVFGYNVNLASDLNVKIDMLVENEAVTDSDTITINSKHEDSTGAINISGINFVGETTGTYPYFEGKHQIVINNDDSDIEIKFTDDVTTNIVTYDNDLLSIDSGTLNWDAVVYNYDLETTTNKKLSAVAGDSGIVDSLEWADNGTTTAEINRVDHDALAFLNQTDLFGEEKSFTATEESQNYVVSEALGTTYGNLIVSGVSSETSTINMNGHSGFEVSEDASLTIRNTQVVGENAIVSSGDVTLDGADIDSATNNGELNLYNNSTFSEISGAGETNIFGDLDLGAGKISGNTVNTSAGTVTVSSDNLADDVVLNVQDGSTIEIADNEVAVKEANFGADTTLSLKVTSDGNGVLRAETINVAEGATLKATLGKGITTAGKTKTVQLLEAGNEGFNNFADIADNNMYHFEKAGLDGAYDISLIKTAEDVVSENGGTKTNEEAAKAWVDSEPFEGGIAGEVADGLADLAQNDGKGFIKALTALAPTDAPVVQDVTLAQNDLLFNAVASHLRGDEAEGLASGDLGNGVSLWAKAYLGSADLEDRGDYHGFSSTGKGIIVGLETKLGNSVKVGAGAQYDSTNVDAYHRDIDVKTTKGFAYAEYKPNAWFVNATASYGRSDYDEDKYALGRTFAAKYSTNTYAAQVLTGYELNYLTPEAGLRYSRIKRHGYKDGAAQTVEGKDLDVLTAVAGVRAAKDYALPCGHTVRPEAYVGVTYDLVSDRDNAVVGLANGADYTVYGKRLNRFGVEVGAGLTAEITDKLSANVNYIGGFRQDYQNHTGMVGIKYAF